MFPIESSWSYVESNCISASTALFSERDHWKSSMADAVLNGRVTSLEKKNLTLESGMQKLQDDLDEHYLTQEVSALYTYDENKNLLSPASDRVCKRSLEAVRTQKNKFVHGDRPKNLGKARAALKRKVLEQVQNRNVSKKIKIETALNHLLDNIDLQKRYTYQNESQNALHFPHA